MVDHFRSRGASAFREGRLEDAAEAYGKAIDYLDAGDAETAAVLHSNRALCFLKLGELDGCAAAARLAVGRDDTSVKGHYYLGRALVSAGELDTGVEHLRRAYGLALGTKHTFAVDIEDSLRKARKKQFFAQQRKQRSRRDHAMYVLEQMMEELALPDDEREERRELFRTAMPDSSSEIVDGSDEHVPEWITCGISFEIMRDPVLLPSGRSYDRRSIEEHFERNGPTDPVSRQTVQAGQVTSNKALCAARDDFFDRFPYMYE